MLASSSLTIIIIILLFLCINAYIHSSSISKQTYFSLRPVIPYIKNVDIFSSSSPLPPVPEYTIPEACENVDFRWIASDRNYWDGWVSKSMFLKKDGRFTRKNVNVLENEDICVLVMLGPIPAVSAIKPTLHYAPSDSIVLTAKSSSGISVTIPLQQHNQQSNVYFGSVRFGFDGLYTLDTSVEYRSYFWESPMLHRYRPNRFSSSNKLNVMKSFRNRNNQLVAEETQKRPICKNDLQGAWMSKVQLQQRDPLRYYDEYAEKFDGLADNTPIYVPTHCRFNYTPKMNCLESKTIHVWGDAHVKRNLQLLKDNPVWCNSDTEPCMCNEWNDDPNLANAVDSGFLESGLDTNIHFAYTSSISNKNNNGLNNLKNEMLKQHKLAKSDVVILSVGSEDLGATRQDSDDFAMAFKSLMLSTLQLYPTQLVVVRTPQYFGKGIYGAEMKWNSGLSEAFANIVRTTFASLLPEQNSRVVLWDTYQLGSNENVCRDNLLSKPYLVRLENELLLSLVCNHPLSK